MDVLISSARIVGELIRRDSDNLAIEIMPQLRLIGQVASKLVIHVMESCSSTKPRPRIRSQRVKVNVVNGFGKHKEDKLMS